MGSKFDSVWVPTLQGAFLTSYEGVIDGQWSTPITKRYDSIGEFLKIVDLGTVGAVRQFSGPRQFTSPKAYTLTQQNLPYELTLPIDVEDVRRDSLGMWETKAAEMGAKFADHVNKLVISNITANPTCFDQTAFFGSSHPVNGTTQTNDVSATQLPALASSGYTGATATAPTPVQMSAVVLGAVALFYGLIDEAGDPINGGAKEFEFVTSNPAVYAALISAIDSLQLSQGQTNVLDALQGGGKARYTMNPKNYRFMAMFDPRLGSATSSVFWVFRTDSEVKPFAWGEENGLEINYLGDGSYNAVVQNQYIWAAKAVRSVGVGRYQHAFRLTLS